jgi:CMP/dCMP kinase
MARKSIITLGGLPGSGKSTTLKLLGDALGFEIFSTGGLVRTMAEERGMSLEAFNELIATDKSIDLEIDSRQEAMEQNGSNLVVDSHLGFHFIPSGFNVYLKISPEESAKRVYNDSDSKVRVQSGDSMTTLQEAVERTRKRIENHRKRYMEFYGVNPYDETRYDLVVDSEKNSPEEVTQIILEEYKRWLEQ